MTTQVEPGTQIERYLLLLRTALGPMPAAEKSEILSDLRSHIEERMADAGTNRAQIAAETIAALGSAESLAASYRRERLMARAGATAEPHLLLRATFQWALTGLRGFVAFLVLLFGYGLGIGFTICALLKPFMPNNVGLWADPPAFTLGVITRPGAHELLGWWMMPVGLTIGPLLSIGTTRLVQWLLRKRAAQYREAL